MSISNSYIIMLPKAIPGKTLTTLLMEEFKREFSGETGFDISLDPNGNILCVFCTQSGFFLREEYGGRPIRIGTESLNPETLYRHVTCVVSCRYRSFARLFILAWRPIDLDKAANYVRSCLALIKDRLRMKIAHMEDISEEASAPS